MTKKIVVGPKKSNVAKIIAAVDGLFLDPKNDDTICLKVLPRMPPEIIKKTDLRRPKNFRHQRHLRKILRNRKQTVTNTIFYFSITTSSPILKSYFANKLALISKT